ncbi:alpha-glucosidase family protein [Oharaeibacter diazotrophicus]|uniref:Alpha-glucosidase n=1 Tax=Oharaeibacter diazotrophicus TaxID=1920512 RepID=A0A4R6RJX1_9HYPH|nr:alpha-glucosidase family protein [Oharaeibacter diazotrophicus]TDP86405.1 alpha-glucosidase [Oharaeibacter diazotrophicus]BBE71652.1 oligo-1,6-glucosidase [Pleomorphomonas sp. SM30]GLS78417.1 alpha-glucosidase [Oharaeibacter diazotrophicus]
MHDPKALTTSATVLPAHEADADWWRGAVIYQIYPRSFQDSNGDGIGDLPGVTARLPYLADLGVDAIWLSPFFTSPMKDFGYDVSNYCDVDPIFGTLGDFQALTAEAHRLGIKVIIDQVISHTSDMHPWFVESRLNTTNAKADWYIWADSAPDGTAPNNWLSVFGGPAWEWDSRRCQYYMHNFLTSQPDLNFHNPEVRKAVLDVLRFWLELGVDGFRLDTVNYYFHDAELRSNPPAPTDGPAGNDAPAVNPYGRQVHLYDKSRPENLDFLKELRSVLDEFPGTTAMGEVGEGSRAIEIMAAYTAGGDKLHMCYSFDLLGDGYGKTFFETTIGRYEASQGGWPCWAFSNHDVPRWASRFLPYAADPLRMQKLVSSLLLSFRGSVCLYEGEELGLGEASLTYDDLVDPYGIRFWPEFKGRDGCRTPMVWLADAPHGGFSEGKPWLPVPADHLPLAADRQVGVEGSLHEHYKRFLAFRRETAPLREGTIEFLPAEGDVMAFVRRTGADAVLCVFNFGHEAATFPLPAGMAPEAVDLGFGSVADADAVTLGPEDAFFGRIAVAGEAT